MVEMKENCPDCGQSLNVRVGESIAGQKLVWWASYDCASCKMQIEEDGQGTLPDRFREKFLETEGVWSLTIEETKTRKLFVIKLLRKLMCWSLAESAIAKNNIPGKIITGTQTEMKWLHKILFNEGLQSSIERES